VLEEMGKRTAEIYLILGKNEKPFHGHVKI
jgi:hypothetical protein